MARRAVVARAADLEEAVAAGVDLVVVADVAVAVVAVGTAEIAEAVATVAGSLKTNFKI